MAHEIEAVVGPDGWITWDALTARVDRKTVAGWVGGGRLRRIQPGVYALPSAAGEWRIRLQAAVRVTGGVVSHRTALALWDLLPPEPRGPVHLTVALNRSGRGTDGLALHRTRDLVDAVRRVDGLPVTSAERAVVDSWGRPGGLSRQELRAAAIDAVRRRLCSPRDLQREIDRRPCLPGRAALVVLVRLLAEGCRSELEIWGCLHVLRGPGMPVFTLQRRIAVAGERFFLDAACDEVLLAVEMDGAGFHGSREQRERDIRRDALLASVGWQTLRFGFRRMTSSPDACRRDIRSAYQARRRLLRLDDVR
jgi:very-short-patch-repair endonuclease